MQEQEAILLSKHGAYYNNVAKRPKIVTAKQVKVSMESFDLGLITLVPSESAGSLQSATSGLQQPNPQASTVQLAQNLKNAVVSASNIRFEDGACSSGPGYQIFSGSSISDAPLMISTAQTLVGKYLIVATASGVYIGSP